MPGKRQNQFGFDTDAVNHMYYRYHWLVKNEKPMVWESFNDFLRWCQGTWYPRTTLHRIDDSKPYGPGNCEWLPMCSSEKYKKELAAQWDKIMQPIREQYRMQIAEAQANAKEYFRYEHPDLVREGIVWAEN